MVRLRSIDVLEPARRDPVAVRRRGRAIVATSPIEDVRPETAEKFDGAPFGPYLANTPGLCQT